MRKKLKQFISVTAAVVLAGSMLSGCGGDPQAGQEDAKGTESAKTEDAGGDDKVITFWHIGTDEPDLSIFEDAADAFNENTDSGYRIECVAFEPDAYKEKLMIAMSSGECPDLYTHWSGGPMNEYVNAGLAQPLDELYGQASWKDKILDATVEQGKYKGKLYGIGMLNVSLSGIYYNKEIFDQYDLKVPTTVSELEALCDTLVENGKIPFALANAPKWTGSIYFMNLAARKGGLEPFKAAVEGSGSFEDECFIYAGQKIQEWVQKGYFPEGVNGLDEGDGQGRQLFYAEDAAMRLIGSWDSGNYMADSQEFYNKVGWFSFPAVDGSDADPSIQIGTMGEQFISFNCTGEKLKAAFGLMDYYFDEAYTQKMAEAGKIPPVNGVDQFISGNLEKELLAKASEAKDLQLWYDQYLPTAVSSVHLDTCQELFGLTITPEEAAREFQEAMEEYNSEQSAP